MKPSVRTVLLVEDNEDDIFFMLRSIKSAVLPWQVHVVKDGQAAIDYLSAISASRGRHGNPQPALIFLDLKLPAKSGLEVLSWIRSNPDYKASIAIMLTTSAEAKDIAAAYDLGANAYLVKPSSVELIPMLQSLDSFWFRYNNFTEPKFTPTDK